MRTLWVTNDFPPRAGGIQSFVYHLVVRQPAGSVVVYASDYPGAAKFDARQPFPVVREDTRVLLPTPAAGRRAVALAREYGCEAVVFGAAAPLGLLAPRLRREAGIRRAVALTHGHETGWAMLPGARQVLRRIGVGLDAMTYLGSYTRTRLAPVLEKVTDLRWLAPGVDTDTFRPDVDGTPVRRRYGLEGRPVVVCVSRLVARKGQDTLIRALPALRRGVGDVALLLVGDGPYRSRLERLARRHRVADHVIFTGTVRDDEMAAHYAAGDVFAMPCRTRWAGVDVEGLGIVYLEASATGLPVVAGDSGGAPEAVRHGETGYVVDGRDLSTLVDRLATLLTDRELASRMGAAGRGWVVAQWRWDLQAARLQELLTAPVPESRGH